jgi:hypothetical protein
MPGTFRIESGFTITNRGFVVAGDILSGSVRVGGWVGLPDGAGGIRLVRVTDISMGRRGTGLPDFVGLLLGELGSDEASALRKSLEPGLEVTVDDPEPGYEPAHVARTSAKPRRWWRFWSAT